MPVVERFGALRESTAVTLWAIVNDGLVRQARISRFRFSGLFLSAGLRHSTLRCRLVYGAYALATAIYRRNGQEHYPAVVAPEPLVSGPIALLIGKLTGARTIVEVDGQYESSYGPRQPEGHG